jgi:hypothetical protein
MSRIQQQISDIHAAGNLVKINGTAIEAVAPEENSLFVLRRGVIKGHWFSLNSLNEKALNAKTGGWLLGALSPSFGIAAYQSATTYAEIDPSTNKDVDAKNVAYHDFAVPLTLFAIGTGIAARELFKAAQKYQIKSLILSGNAKIAEQELKNRGATYSPN